MMENKNASPLPIWYWVVATIASLWFLMDFISLVMRVFLLDNMISGLPEEQAGLYSEMPLWVNIVFAVEAICGLFACMGLMLKRKWATVFFCMSILGVLSQTFYIYFLSSAIAIMGAPALVMPLVAILIGIALIVFAKNSIAKGWLQ